VTAPEGFTHRPAAVAEADAVAELMNEFDRAHLEEPDTVDAAEVARWWSRIDLEFDTRLYFGAGRLAGAATVYERNAGQLDLDAFVRPDLKGRGLGSAMIDWLEHEARRRRLDIARTSALAADEPAKDLIESRGFRPVRHFYRMSIDLEEPPAAPVWPAGFAVSTLRPGEEELVRAVTEESFAEHWGHEPRDLEHWQATTFGAEWWDPSLVHLVRAGDEVVAAQIAAIRFGSGWIGTLGTRAPWRGRGLGRAMLLTAFAELYRRGERRIALAVDAGNETGATHLYEQVGMRVAWQADVYEKRM